MKFSCSKEDLVRAVQIVQKGVSSKPQMPILSGIYLKAENNVLELQATDYELGVSCKIKANIDEPGIVVLSGRYFQEVVRRLPGDTVNIFNDQTEHTVKIVSNMAKFNLINLPSAEFPVLRPLEGTTSLMIRDNIFRDLIKKTVFACSTDEAKPIFTGALLEISDSNVTMVATNTHRLAIKREILDDIAGNIKIIIPAKILNELAKIITDDVPNDINITCTNNQICFSFDDIFIISRLIEGQFPNYDRVIPKEFATNIIVNTSEFTEAVERVSLISRSGEYNVIKLSFKDNCVMINSNNPEIGKAEESVDVAISGNGVDIAFNCKYVIDILKNLGSERFYFSLNTPLSAANISPMDDDSFNYIITPVRTSGE